MLRLNLAKHPVLIGRWQTQIFRRDPQGPSFRLMLLSDGMAAVVVVAADCPTFVGYAPLPEATSLLQSPYQGQDWRPIEEQVYRLAQWLQVDVWLHTNGQRIEGLGDSISARHRKAVAGFESEKVCKKSSEVKRDAA